MSEMQEVAEKLGKVLILGLSANEKIIQEEEISCLYFDTCF